MVQSVSLKPEAIRTLGFASISGTYAIIGTAITNPSQVYYIQNLTDVTITFSQDAVNDHFILPAGGFVLIDAGANKGLYGSLSFNSGTSLFAKGSPTSGSVYLTTLYMG